ncbi:helix-turn-helix domain-containing protein [Citricoccus parietis]|uniref:Helix-turn-helix domain-containing protein n=2 Tax=Citricoccus parietis TaxID=592307 RepID=A0ABV6F469_9MICC
MVGRRSKGTFPYAERSLELGRLLKSERQHVLKISRRELAERSGVAESSIQAIEDGRTLEPGLFTVISLGVALGLDLGDMMRSLTGAVHRKTLSPNRSAKDEAA